MHILDNFGATYTINYGVNYDSGHSSKVVSNCTVQLNVSERGFVGIIFPNQSIRIPQCARKLPTQIERLLKILHWRSSRVDSLRILQNIQLNSVSGNIMVPSNLVPSYIHASLMKRYKICSYSAATNLGTGDNEG